jgi:hypothetical protein
MEVVGLAVGRLVWFHDDTTSPTEETLLASPSVCAFRAVATIRSLASEAES